MKKEYEKPTIEEVKLSEEDIITTSSIIGRNLSGDVWEDDGNNFGLWS